MSMINAQYFNFLFSYIYIRIHACQFAPSHTLMNISIKLYSRPTEPPTKAFYAQMLQSPNHSIATYAWPWLLHIIYT